MRPSAGTPPASIRLLGPLDVDLGTGASVALESARAESLLAYLLLHRDAATPRHRLAFLLWPDSTEEQARTYLRHLLHTLLRRVPEADRYLDVTARTVRWRTEVPCRVDVAEFEALLATTDPAARSEALREAVALYGGDLVEGCDDEWLLDEQKRLRQRLLAALDELVRVEEAAGALPAALGYGTGCCGRIPCARRRTST